MSTYSLSDTYLVNKIASRLTQRTHHDDRPDLEPRIIDTKSNASTIRPPSFPRIPSPIIINFIPIICCNLHRGPRGFCVIKDDYVSLQFYFTKKYIQFLTLQNTNFMF